VLVNLLNNALKFSNENQNITVEFKLLEVQILTSHA